MASLAYSELLLPDPSESPATFFSALPREFQVIQEPRVPLLQIIGDDEDPSDPSYFQDFIIIAEFSELEGPIPLATIPQSASTQVPIDLSSFAVHLMSTDYQVNAVGHFKINDDTQVLRQNVFKNVHVFMEYVTLYDLKARGFVRPFCFGYVTKDHKKLDHQLDMFIRKFDKVTKVLKLANRRWFASELEVYLDKLGKAKDSLIEMKGSDAGQDPDSVTPEQITHQYSEIEIILRTVNSFNEKEPPCYAEELDRLNTWLGGLPSRSDLLQLLAKLRINDFPEEFDIPLLHPLKAKGEPLRPLTMLGQLGTVYLLWHLTVIYGEHQRDLIFSVMSELTEDFEDHCRILGKNRNNNVDDQSELADGDERQKSLQKVLLDPEFSSILEQTHLNRALIQNPPSPNKSGSYYTVSEEGDFIIPEFPLEPLATTSSGYVESNVDKKQAMSPSEISQNEEVIQHRPWHEWLQNRLLRGSPGYGILKFFRHHSKVAHHAFYSILAGRPLVICGPEDHRSKIGRYLTSLIPFVPVSPAAKTWKVLRWHRGVLIKSHLKEYKLIGLCIPERLEVHDLIHPRDQNGVTILKVSDKKSVLLGPAYNGEFLERFRFDDETDSSPVHRHFQSASDLVFANFIGSVLTEIQTKVFMMKSLQERDPKDRAKYNFKELKLKGTSDLEIFRYLSTLIPNADAVLQLF